MNQESQPYPKNLEVTETDLRNITCYLDDQDRRTHPGEQRLRRATDLGGNGFNGGPQGRMIGTAFGNHAHGALTQFGAELN